MTIKQIRFAAYFALLAGVFGLVALFIVEDRSLLAQAVSQVMLIAACSVILKLTK